MILRRDFLGILVVFFVAGGIAGFLIPAWSRRGQPLPPSLSPSLPVSLQYLQHPAVSYLNAIASGVVVEKDDDAFTIEKDGKRLVIDIALEGSITLFKKNGVVVSSSELAVGDRVSGGVTVTVQEDALYAYEKKPVPGLVVAQRFTIE